ncbi:histidine phosphatase family protein [Vannielia litorea]|uniref:Probable phosphoglycerate mutase n=1 Tax=Vannielia litorea TaxID=1217970 RepID=A0A1N6IDH0_9RHOB|nr:histidine phosphatase family protein [Vannielia litorea]SIO30084.1 probable phosphoglycerate mutase [Vannielia litorea]
MTLPLQPFVVIRHGQTDANRDGRIAGRIEAQLTDTGRAAARALAGRAWPARLAVFSSPQQRARETAKLAFPHHAAWVLDGLRERDWGQFEGRPIAEAPPRLETPEGGEAWQAVIDRVAAAVAEAALRAEGHLPVLVAHSGVIRALRQITGGSAHGPSPANTTPCLFTPSGGAWRETTLDMEHEWTA